MSETVITSLDQLSPAWLTGVLTASGALIKGSVEAFEVDSGERLLSTSIRLKLAYSASSRGNCPARLFLKLVNTNLDDEFFGASEVNYYSRDYINVPNAPLIRCYDSAYSAELERYHILLDDVSATHVEVAARPPTLEYGLALAEALATLHAPWWGFERLAENDAPQPDAARINRFIDIAHPGAAHILAAIPDRLPPAWHSLISEIFAKHPRLLIERFQDGNGFALVHGDVNLHNILIPRAGVQPLYIIDRQPFDWSLPIWLGVYDLAYAMGLEWEVELRRQFEQPVLRQYHAALLRLGVQGYAWEQLWHDYRLMLPMNVYVATEWCRGMFNPDTMPTWLPMLEKSLTAVEDLNCAELWR